MLIFIATSFFSFKVLMEYRRTGIAPNAEYLGGGGKVSKSDISYPQSTHTAYKEDDEAFDSRLDVTAGGRETGYSFEDARVQGGAPTGGYGSHTPYGAGYASLPAVEDADGHNGRPISFGGPLGGNRV